MKKNHIVLLLFGVLLMLAGCKKDNPAGIPEGALLLTTESFVGPGGAKTSVSNTTVQWDNGDTVKLNGTPYRVTVSGSQAYVDNFTPPTSGDYYGYYPHDLTVVNPNQDNATVTVPSVYRCRYSGGRQVIKLPLIGRANYDANTISFLHVTAAVKLDIKNAMGVPVVLDSVVVSSASQQLSGSRGVTISVGGLTVNARQGGDLSDADRKVKVLFTDSPVIATNCTTEVQVPFLPISSIPDDFTISIYSHITGAAPGEQYVFYHTGTNSHDLVRNEMMTAKVALSDGGSSHATGLIVVDPTGKKVIFSQANLKYQASTGKWRFHDDQMDYIGYAAGNTTAEANRARQSDWIDLFGWGTGTSTKAILVSVSNDNYTIYNEWGVNAIENGGNTANFGWRTLTSTEWDYVLNTRTTLSSARYAQVEIVEDANNTHQGLVIFPDDYSLSVTGLITNTPNSLPTENQISLDTWRQMEAAGAVFLPAAGLREKLNTDATVALRVSNAGSQGLYWSSSVDEKTNSKAHRLLFDNTSQAGDFSPVNTHDCYLGCAVRLVMDVVPGQSN